MTIAQLLPPPLPIIVVSILTGEERQKIMSNLTAEKVASVICGEDRSGKFDDVCRKKVATVYGGYTEGLNEVERDRFDMLTRNVLSNVVNEGSERNKLFAKNAAASAQIECIEENKLPSSVLTSEQNDVLETCTDSRIRQVDVDQIAGSFNLFGVFRSFSETFDLIRKLSMGVVD